MRSKSHGRRAAPAVDGAGKKSCPAADVVLDAMPDAVCITDIEGRVTKVNNSYAKFYGYGSVDEAEGTNWSDVVAKKDLERAWRAFQEGALKTGKLENFEATNVRRDGSEFQALVSCSVVKDTEGKAVGYIAMIKDITELKRLQEKERAAAETDKKRAAELEERSAALLSILEDEVEAKEKLGRAYKELAIIERAQAFAYVLFKQVLRPLLMECHPRTIGKVRDEVEGVAKKAPLVAGVKVTQDGRVDVDEGSIREALSALSPEESMSEVVSTFSEIMRACYPLIKADLGDERASAMVSKVLLDLFKKPKASAYKVDLLRVVPDGVEIPGTYRVLDVGKSYLVEEKTPEHAFGMFNDMLTYGFQGLCISAMHPADVKKDYPKTEVSTVLWLSKTEEDYAISPSSLGLLRNWITTFISRNENAVVLLDGIEYLITTNGFDLALKFLHDVRESITLNRAGLIVPVSPATLDPKQLAILERYMEPIEVVKK